MLAPILADRDFSQDDSVVVLVSGLGATPVMELYIFYAEVGFTIAAAARSALLGGPKRAC